MSDELHRAFNILELMGVSRERAKSVDNGIMVLDQRHERQHESDRVRIRELEAREATWAMRHERETKIADKAWQRVIQLEAALREIADFSEQFIGDDEDGDERMYKVNQIADTVLASSPESEANP